MGINKFIQGHAHFKKNFFTLHEKELFASLKDGQNPTVLFICCSDSRIVPSIILNTKPGDFFYIRNVGNIIPPYQAKNDINIATAAALEYAVNILKVHDIIVCGHSNCGACFNLHQNIEQPELAHVKKWLDLNAKSKNLSEMAKSNNIDLETPISEQKFYELTERISVLCQVENLLTYPFVKKLADTEQIHIHAWYYDIANGKLDYYDSEQYKFKPLDELIEP